ncbi:thioredoxin family protein [Mycoplasma sp. Ms02]|uniref:thioredoxin family protein n=1 Tax=Mycoplasma sp. Ms02 TaxID=353851 RepID=UPI00351D494C
MQKLIWKEAQERIASTKDKLIFLEFTTEWCGDCKMMAPVINQVEEEFKENKFIEFIKVDAEEAQLFRNPDSKWKVLRVPTHLLIKNNEILNKGYEYYPKEIIANWIENALATVEDHN